MGPLRLGAFYGAIGFAIGFVFGTLRELLLIPWLGEDTGRLLEFPLVVLGVVIAARWLFNEPAAGAWPLRLLSGVIGVVVLVALESALALGALRMPLEAYLRGYDITQGALFPLGLLIMALAPVLTVRSRANLA